MSQSVQVPGFEPKGARGSDGPTNPYVNASALNDFAIAFGLSFLSLSKSCAAIGCNRDHWSFDLPWLEQAVQRTLCRGEENNYIRIERPREKAAKKSGLLGQASLDANCIPSSVAVIEMLLPLPAY